MKLPIAPVKIPADLKGVKNGELPEALLVECGLGSFKMHPLAARAMKALIAAASEAGFKVRTTGTYRSRAAQETLFLARYSKQEIEGRPTKTWNGVKYWQRPSTAIAAVPGTSNHGWGLACDFAEERDGDPQPESVSSAFVSWMIENAARWGYSAELQSEPWHWRYVAAEAIPPAVLAFEAGEPQPPAQQPETQRPTLRRGDRGAHVMELQRLLTARGFSTRGTDGVFGKFTEGAVRRFQAANPSCGPVDGIVGPRTWKVLAA